MSYTLVYTQQACKDAKKLKGTHLAEKAKDLLELIQKTPFADPPALEVLVGDLKGAYSIRLNIKHRLVYQALEDEAIIKVFRLWTHYE